VRLIAPVLIKFGREIFCNPVFPSKSRSPDIVVSEGKVNKLRGKPQYSISQSPFTYGNRWDG